MVTQLTASLPTWTASYNKDRPLHNKSFLSVCYAPYVNLDFSPNGEVFVCCVNTTYPVGKIPEDTILGIWQGEKIARLRDHLKQYDFTLGCGRCRWQVDLKNFSGVFAKRDDIFEVSQDPPDFPQRMDFRLRNTCNFACVMCNGDYSSVIRTREGRPPFPQVYHESFFQQLDECIPYLKEAKFAGGEPFLVPEHFLVWDLIIKHGSKVRCMVNTNASIMNDQILYYLENMAFSNIGVSCDGATKETFEAIRRGGSFEQVLKHTKVFKRIADRKGHKVHFAVCVMPQNWREFPEIVRLAEDLGCPVNVNLVYHPPSCSLYELPQDEIRSVRLYLEHHLARMQSWTSEETKIHWRILIESLAGAETKSVDPPFAHRAAIPVP